MWLFDLRPMSRNISTVRSNRQTSITGDDKQKYPVIFPPLGRRDYIDKGKTIMEAAQELGVGLESVRGGHATAVNVRLKGARHGAVA